MDTKPNENEKQVDFPIVGLGASAGGLEAFASFFSHTPPDTGMDTKPLKKASGCRWSCAGPPIIRRIWY